MISIGFSRASSLAADWGSGREPRHHFPVLFARLVNHESAMKRLAVDRTDSLTETASQGPLGFPMAHNAAIVDKCVFNGSEINKVYAGKGS